MTLLSSIMIKRRGLRRGFWQPPPAFTLHFKYVSHQAQLYIRSADRFTAQTWFFMAPNRRAVLFLREKRSLSVQEVSGSGGVWMEFRENYSPTYLSFFSERDKTINRVV